MNIPVLVLLGFAAWTLLTLIGSVGVYRWSRILTGRASVAEWRADVPQGCEWYQRSMRAHMNCVENLPLFAALVVALMATYAGCARGANRRPHNGTAFEPFGRTALRPFSCPGRLHDRDRHRHRSVDDIVMTGRLPRAKQFRMHGPAGGGHRYAMSLRNAMTPSTGPGNNSRNTYCMLTSL
jgi:hypothetical protein